MSSPAAHSPAREAIIDVHAHALTDEAVRAIAAAAPELDLQLTATDERSMVLKVAGIVQNPFPRAAMDMAMRLADLDATGIDRQVVSPPPHFFLYESDAAVAARTSEILNDELAALALAHPDRLLTLATVPLQDPHLAVRELERAMALEPVRGVQIGSNVRGANLDDSALEPFWEAAAALGCFVLVHPHKIAAGERMKSYYLKNLIGNPLETTIAAASLLFSGVLTRHPRLKVCLSHGGGFVPYQAGRFRHGWNIREEGRGAIADGIDAPLGRFLYDTIVHAEDALAFLVAQAGADHVLLGSDYPFDMGTLDGLRQVKALSLAPDAEKNILGNNARTLFAPRGVQRAEAIA